MCHGIISLLNVLLYSQERSIHIHLIFLSVSYFAIVTINR